MRCLAYQATSRLPVRRCPVVLVGARFPVSIPPRVITELRHVPQLLLGEPIQPRPCSRSYRFVLRRSSHRLIPPITKIAERVWRIVRLIAEPLSRFAACCNNTTRSHNSSRDVGLIEAGRLADLVLLGASPMDNIANTRVIQWVMKGGKRVALRPLQSP
jgi:hypothetical protein